MKPTIHQLSNININLKEADCQVCGKVTIYFNKSNHKWYCGKTKVKKTKDQFKHILSEICTKTRTAKCQNCGWVRIRKDGDRLRCNRSCKGKTDRLKLWFRQQKKRFCEKCGFKCIQHCQLDIHHKDHNHHNNNLDNLITLCANCHSLEHVSTYEQLDNNRIANLLQKRWSILLGFEDKEAIILEPGHKNTKQLKHKLNHICNKSRTAYCEICGLVSIIIRTDKQGFKYWACNQDRLYVKRDSKNAEQQLYKKYKKNICELCGFIPEHTCQLAIHHIDENHHNNHPNNLQTVCHCCHKLLHYKSDEELEKNREAAVIALRVKSN